MLLEAPAPTSRMVSVMVCVTADGVGHLLKTGQALTQIADACLLTLRFTCMEMPVREKLMASATAFALANGAGLKMRAGPVRKPTVAANPYPQQLHFPQLLVLRTSLVAHAPTSLMVSVMVRVTADGVGHLLKTGQALTPIADACLWTLQCTCMEMPVLTKLMANATANALVNSAGQQDKTGQASTPIADANP